MEETTSMKKLPIDVSDFPTIISDDYLYVDKTYYIYQLITKGRLYFLSRPRRFGKSLLISTLKEIFSGNKNLFQDLWIGKSDYSWPSHPVISLNFSKLDFDTPTDLRAQLKWTIGDLAFQNTINVSSAPSAGAKLELLVRKLAQKNKVVILIDEYDAPLLKYINEPKVVSRIREIISSFFTVIKSLDEYCRAIFITGVSQFSKASIFSGMNNLNDITLKPEAEVLLGYTQKEISEYFSEYINSFAQARGIDSKLILDEMQRWYNGYCFSEDTQDRVYNPYSVLYYLNDKKLKNYWFQTGTPSFLMNLIKTQFPWLREIEEFELSGENLGKFDINDIPLIPVLFQTGYLTIKSYNHETGKYKLDYPNEEVRRSFKEYLLGALSNTSTATVEPMISTLKRAIESTDIGLFCSVIESVLASIPYYLHKPSESYYHSLLLIILDLLKYETHAEVATNIGRIDLAVPTPNRIFIFEFKFNATAQEALDQIKDREYYKKYMHKGKPITLVGISFNFAGKELSLDWAQEAV